MSLLFCRHAINISSSILRYNRVTGKTTNMPPASVPERSILETSTVQNFNIPPIASSGAVQAQVQRFLRSWIAMLMTVYD